MQITLYRIWPDHHYTNDAKLVDAVELEFVPRVGDTIRYDDWTAHVRDVVIDVRSKTYDVYMSPVTCNWHGRIILKSGKCEICK